MGRERSSCDIVFQSRYISRVHCVLVVEAHRVRVRDLGSINGVRINNRRVEESVICLDDELRLGQLRFRLVELDASGRESPPIPESESAPDLDSQTLSDDAGQLENADPIVVKFLDSDEPRNPPSFPERDASVAAEERTPHSKARLSTAGVPPASVRKRGPRRIHQPARPQSTILRPLNLAISPRQKVVLVVVAAVILLVGIATFRTGASDNHAIYARLIELHSLAQQKHQEGARGELLSATELEELQTLVKRLQMVASAKEQISQSLLRAARDGLQKGAKGAFSEREWRLAICATHLEDARRLIQGERRNDMNLDSRFPVPGWAVTQ